MKQLRLIIEHAPVILRLVQVGTGLLDKDKGVQEKAGTVIVILEAVAEMTSTELDNQILAIIADIVSDPDFWEMVDSIIAVVDEAFFTDPDAPKVAQSGPDAKINPMVLLGILEAAKLIFQIWKESRSA